MIREYVLKQKIPIDSYSKLFQTSTYELGFQITYLSKKSPLIQTSTGERGFKMTNSRKNCLRTQKNYVRTQTISVDSYINWRTWIRNYVLTQKNYVLT